MQIMAKLELEATDRWVAKLKAKLKESQEVLKNERIKLFSLPSETREEDDKRKNYFEKQAKDLLEKTQKEGGFGAYMQGMGCKSYNTYKKCFDQLVEWGFVKVVKKAVNQHQW